MIALMITGALLLAGLALWAARGDFYDEQGLDERSEVQELRDAAEAFGNGAIGLPVAPEPFPGHVRTARLRDRNGRAWEFARIDGQVWVREAETDEQEPR